jgi:hypothetical protein
MMLTSSFAWAVYVLSALLLIVTAAAYPVMRKSAIRARRIEIAIESQAAGGTVVADE